MIRNLFTNIVQNSNTYEVNQYVLLDIHWSPLSLLFIWYRYTFQAAKRPGREASAQVNPLKIKRVCFIQGHTAYGAVNTIGLSYTRTTPIC